MSTPSSCSQAPETVTTGPIQGSEKIYQELPNGLRVPQRRVNLTNGEYLTCTTPPARTPTPTRLSICTKGCRPAPES